MTLKPITSLNNPRVKDAIRLRSARHRGKQGRFLIDGARELQLALAGGVVLTDLFLCLPWCTSPESQQILAHAAESNADAWQVSENVFQKLAFGERRDGVLAVAETPHRTLAELPLRPEGLIAVIEGVEKPGNVGAVLRSADGAGVAAVIVADPATDLYNPNCIRASLGTVFTMPVCTASSSETLAWLRQHRRRIFAARVDAEGDYTAADLGENAAVVLGSEAAGLSTCWYATDIAAIKLPMRGAADSLNISAAAAVLFYEALRQRQNGK